METYSIYHIVQKGLLLNRKCKPIKSYNHAKGIVDSWGYKPVNGAYRVRQADIDDHNERMRKVMELIKQ